MTGDRVQQTVANTNVAGNLTQTVVVAGGSSLGNGVWPWRQWRERVDAGAPGPLAEATRTVTGTGAIRRLSDIELERHVTEWLDSARGGATTVALRGRHGTGRSVAVAALGLALERAGVDAVFVVDDYLRFEATDLRLVLPSDRRSVLLIDDADLHRAYRPVYNAVGSIDVCAVGSFSFRAQAEAFAALASNASPRRVVALPDHPSQIEVGQLQAVIGAAAPRRTAITERHNLRTVRRILLGDPPPDALARRLVSLRRDPAVAQIAGALMWCGMREILVPSSLLVRFGGGPIPAELEPWLASRSVDDGIESLAYWIEDRAVLGLAERTWRDSGALDRSAYLEEMAGTLGAMLVRVDPERAGHRVVHRQVLRRSALSLATSLAETSAEVLLECVEREAADRSALLAWANAVPGQSTLHDRVRDCVTARIVASSPDVGALVAHLSELESGGDGGRHLAAIPGLATLDQWAEVLELFDGRNALLGAAAFRAAMDQLRAEPSGPELIALRNCGQILARNIIRDGRHLDRTWLRDVLLDAEELRASHAQFLIEVTERCVMQERHRVGLDRRWRPASADLDDVRALEMEYDRLWAGRFGYRVDEVIERVQHVIEGDALLDHLTFQLLAFTEHFDPGALPELTETSWQRTIDAIRRDGLRHCHGSTRKLLEMSMSTEPLSAPRVSALLRLLDDTGFDGVHPFAVIPSVLGAAVAVDDTEMSAISIATIRASLLPEPHERLAEVLKSWSALCTAAGVSGTGAFAALDWPSAIERGLFAFVPAILTRVFMRLPADSRALDLQRLIAQYGDSMRHRRQLVSCALLAEDVARARALVPPDAADHRQWLALLARLRVAEGDLAGARAILRDGAGSTEGRRQNPVAIALAERDLARATMGYESQMWSMLAGLSMPGELRPIGSLRSGQREAAGTAVPDAEYAAEP